MDNIVSNEKCLKTFAYQSQKVVLKVSKAEFRKTVLKQLKAFMKEIDLKTQESEDEHNLYLISAISGILWKVEILVEKVDYDFETRTNYYRIFITPRVHHTELLNGRLNERSTVNNLSKEVKSKIEQLPDSFALNCEQEGLESPLYFERLQYDKLIDISNWTIRKLKREDSPVNTLSSGKAKGEIFNYVKNEFRRIYPEAKFIMINNSNIPKEDVKLFSRSLEDIGKVEDSLSLDLRNYQEFIENRMKQFAPFSEKNYIFVTTLRKDNEAESNEYEASKSFFISKGLISQNLYKFQTDRNSTDKLNAYERQHLLLEIIHKLGFSPISIPYPNDIDTKLSGFLYLEDLNKFLKMKSDNRVFGSIFTYGYRSEDYSEKVFTFQDKSGNAEDGDC